MVVLGVLLFIGAAFLLVSYLCRLHCPRCGWQSPQLLDEKKGNARNLRQKIITPTDFSSGCHAGVFLEVIDVEYRRTYRCINPQCLHIWQQTEQIIEEYKPGRNKL